MKGNIMKITKDINSKRTSKNMLVATLVMTAIASTSVSAYERSNEEKLTAVEKNKHKPTMKTLALAQEH
jgi:hypothetical protein